MTQQPSQPDDALDKAWARIGLSPWHQLAWFVKLANTDLTALSPGDVSNLQDDCQAIRSRHISFRPTPSDRKRYPFLHGWMGSLSPTPTDLQNIQAAIVPHLKRLADGHSTDCGPITVNHTIRFRKSNNTEQQAGYPPYRINHIAIYSGNVWPDELLLRMAWLLDQPRKGSVLFVDSIRRCPQCTKVFVQLRGNANYCGRACHSVAGMRRLRAKRALVMSGKKQGCRAIQKGRSRHGKKRR